MGFNGYGKHKGLPSGAELLSQKQLEFLDWFIDPHRQGTQNDWCRQHGVTLTDPARWKKNLSFRKEWERRAKELNLGPERVQMVVEALHDKAINGDTKAMELYLRYAERLNPPQEKRDSSVEVSDMSTEDVKAMLAKLLTTEGASDNG